MPAEPPPAPDLAALPILRRVHAVYRALWGELERPPSRRDIDPVRFGQLLPHLMLLEVHRDQQRLRVRLAGDVIERQSGYHSMRGRWIDETQRDPATAAEAYDGVVSALDQGAERLVERRIARADGMALRYYALTMPLLRLPEEPEMALVAVEYRAFD